MSLRAPVLAADVKHSYDTLMGPHTSPAYKTLLADVAGLDVLDERTVRYRFKKPNRELPLTVGGLPVFSRQWGNQIDPKTGQFDEHKAVIGAGSEEEARGRVSHTLVRGPDTDEAVIVGEIGKFLMNGSLYRGLRPVMSRPFSSMPVRPSTTWPLTALSVAMKKSCQRSAGGRGSAGNPARSARPNRSSQPSASRATASAQCRLFDFFGDLFVLTLPDELTRSQVSQ